jgi:site-specific recombinase XerD
MAAVRPEFRREVLVFDAADPVFGGPRCGVRGCVRPLRSRGLCQGHHHRWLHNGSPDLEEFTATASPRFAREVLTCCQAPGCRFGMSGRGLCDRHLSAWRRAGRPELPEWLATLPKLNNQLRAVCLIPDCELWAQPTSPFCRTHHRTWIVRGRPELDGYLTRFDDAYDRGGLPAYETVDLRGLPSQLKLEMQYVLQRRRDEETIKTPADPVRGLVTFLLDSRLDSFLDWNEETWRQRFTADNSRKRVHLALAIYAHSAVEDLAHGSGWDMEYPRDTWRLRKLGITHARATIAFGGIVQPWLKDLVKRWTRWRLSTGLGANQAAYGPLALTRFSAFLARAGVDGMAAIDRRLLERYLADLHAEYAGRTTHGRHIGQLNTFFDAIRRHHWDSALPATATIYPEDYPKHGYRPPRALAEHVMNQLEDPANLDRWDDPAHRLLTAILMRCGLRISSALTLDHDPVVRDGDGAPYLRYLNTKMKREALVPIDEGLVEQIRAQQQRNLQRWPDGTLILFPRPNANLRGEHPIGSQVYRKNLRAWLERCDVRDEHGRPARLTPHQWRHTLGTRLINKDVPQEVVRKILDHDSPQMTAHYARLHDTTVREHWERAHKVNAQGETVILDPGGPLAEAAWAKQRLGRATQALPNGYCGLPIQQSCPHANSCLTCPTFITTAEFLPQHRTHHQQVLQLITAAEARGQTRMVEMNRRVADNLEKIITALDDDRPDQEAADAS